MTDIIDYDAQEAPFRKWEQIKQKMNEVIHKPDPEPSDWLDELEAERLEAKAERMKNANP